MNEPKRSRAILGFWINLFFVFALAFHTLLYYKKWDVVNIPPDTKLSYDEKLLHICNYELVPIIAGAMGCSAFLFWRIRK
jgi:hypothetical protein